MYDETFKDFKLEQKVTDELFEKYGEVLPEEITNVWREYGFGSLLGGYLKLINPDEYREVLDIMCMCDYSKSYKKYAAIRLY